MERANHGAGVQPIGFPQQPAAYRGTVDLSPYPLTVLFKLVAGQVCAIQVAVDLEQVRMVALVWLVKASLCLVEQCRFSIKASKPW